MYIHTYICTYTQSASQEVPPACLTSWASQAWSALLPSRVRPTNSNTDLDNMAINYSYITINATKTKHIFYDYYHITILTTAMLLLPSRVRPDFMMMLPHRGLPGSA